MLQRKMKISKRREGKRRKRVRGKITGTADIPRLTVFKSLKNVSVQIIDDATQTTLLGLASNSKALASVIEAKDSKTEQAKKVGMAIAEQALEKGIKQVVFDRNKYRYHGRIKAVAEGAREKGLEF